MIFFFAVRWWGEKQHYTQRDQPNVRHTGASKIFGRMTKMVALWSPALCCLDQNQLHTLIKHWPSPGFPQLSFPVHFRPPNVLVGLYADFYIFNHNVITYLPFYCYCLLIHFSNYFNYIIECLLIHVLSNIKKRINA